MARLSFYGSVNIANMIVPGKQREYLHLVLAQKELESN